VKKDIYHIFAEDGNQKGYGLPKVHIMTSGVKLHAEWGAMMRLCKRIPNLEKMVAVYEVPKDLRWIKGYRDLTPNEADTWINDLAHLRKNGDYNNKTGFGR
jgi:hypothetical protein